MQPEILNIHKELWPIQLHLTFWNDPTADPERTSSRGYVKGIQRAFALLKGGRVWDWEDKSEWHVLILDAVNY